MVRVMAVLGWLMLIALAVLCFVLALSDPETAGPIAENIARALAQNQTDGVMGEGSGFVSPRNLLFAAGLFLLGANVIGLARLFSVTFGRNRSRKDILFEDEIGTTTIEISALEQYLSSALSEDEEIEEVDLDIEMPQQDGQPIVIEVRCRVRARENIPGMVEDRVKKRTRETFLDIIPLDVAPIVRAHVDLGTDWKPRKTAALDGVLRASTRTRTTRPERTEPPGDETPSVRLKTELHPAPPPEAAPRASQSAPSSAAPPAPVTPPTETPPASPPEASPPEAAPLPPIFTGQASYPVDDEDLDEDEDEESNDKATS